MFKTFQPVKKVWSRPSERAAEWDHTLITMFASLLSLQTEIQWLACLLLFGL